MPCQYMPAHLGHHRHHIGVAPVDVAQQLGEAPLVDSITDGRKGAKLLEGLDIPITYLWWRARTAATRNEGG